MIKKLPYPKFILVVALTFLCYASMAQKYSVGIRGGISYTWPGFGDKEAKQQFNRGMKFGYHGGLLLTFPLKNRYDLVLEGGASQKGRILKFDNGEWKNNLTMNMADMAMLLRKNFTIHLDKNTPADVFVSLGPDINYWISAKGKFQSGDNIAKYGVKFNESPDGNTDYRNLFLNDINRWYFGIALGVGMKAPLGRNQHITTELRFASGHTFMGKKESGSIDILAFEGKDTYKTNLKTISLSLAYSIDLDKVERRKGKSTIKRRMKRQ
jgi:hypothetical protein